MIKMVMKRSNAVTAKPVAITKCLTDQCGSVEFP
jgi:hypothetical protein